MNSNRNPNSLVHAYNSTDISKPDTRAFSKADANAGNQSIKKVNMNLAILNYMKSTNQLTLEMAMAVSTQALLGELIMEFTFKSRSSSADFWDCYICKMSDKITFAYSFLMTGCSTCITPSMFNG